MNSHLMHYHLASGKKSITGISTALNLLLLSKELYLSLVNGLTALKMFAWKIALTLVKR